jgi:hypothetical protein
VFGYSVSGSATPPRGTPGRIATCPVGLKVLTFIGYPVQRALWGRRRASLFYFPIISVMVLSGPIYLVGIVISLHCGPGVQFVASPLVPSILTAMAWGNL